MERGWTKSYRRETDEPSQIWLMPPMYHRIFYFLRQAATWEPRLIPNKGTLGTWLAPGSIITSVDKIVEGVSYYDKGDLRTPAKRTILDVLLWLEAQDMITRLSNNRGTLIYINNWDTYQADYHTDYHGDYHSDYRTDYRTDYHTQHHGEHHGDYRGDYLYKEVIELKELIRSLNIHPGGGDPGDIKPGNNGDGPPGINQAAEFKSLWARYPLKDGSAKAKRIFNDTVKNLGDLKDINQALNNYLAHLKRHPRKKIKNGSTWFEGWQDWIEWKDPETLESKERAERIKKLKAQLKGADKDIHDAAKVPPTHRDYHVYEQRARYAKEWRPTILAEIKELEALTQGAA